MVTQLTAPGAGSAGGRGAGSPAPRHPGPNILFFEVLDLFFQDCRRHQKSQGGDKVGQGPKVHRPNQTSGESPNHIPKKGKKSVKKEEKKEERRKSAPIRPLSGQAGHIKISSLPGRKAHPEARTTPHGEGEGVRADRPSGISGLRLGGLRL